MRQFRNRLGVIARLARRISAWGLPQRSLVFGPLSLGDDLLCTAVLREARRRGTPFVMFTARPELFAGNSDPIAVHPIDEHYFELLRRAGRVLIKPYYVATDSANPQRDLLPPRHIIAEMCRLAGLTGEISLRPYLTLTEAERTAAPRLLRQIAIQSSGLSAAIPYATKEWGAQRFAEVAHHLSADFALVQLGTLRDPLLPGVALDMRGKTTLREAAAIQATSLCFVGLEGFLAHLARAVDCPSIIIHGGRAPAGIFDYAANVNLYGRPDCSPCGLRTGCPYDLECMSAIKPEHVISATRHLARRSDRTPLRVALDIV